MEQKPPPSYANGVLAATGFKFQPCKYHGCRLEIKQLSSLDIDSVIRDVKIELLSSLVEDFVWCEINESDIKLYGDIAVAKLIRVAQLIIEYLIHAKDKLASNLNALAKKYSAKKREIETLSKSPHHLQLASPGSRASWPIAETSSTSSHYLCPIHECNPIKSPDVIDEDASSKFTTTLNNDSFHVHVISSTNAIYRRMNVEESITVQNLKNKLISRLLLADGACKTNFDSHSLYYKDNELKDSSRTLNDYQVGNGEAIVFMPRHQHDESDGLQRSIESKLEKLASIATTSHEELILATRAFQFQLSMQEVSKDAFLNDIGKHIRDAFHSQVQQATVAEDMNNHEEASNTSSKKPLTVVEGKETNEPYQSQGDASSKSEHGQETGVDGVDSRELSDVPLRVDTSAKGFSVVVSPFHPPSEIVSPFKLPCECEIAQNIAKTDAMGKIETPKSMNRTVNADLEIEFSMNSLNSMLDDVDEVVDKLAGTPSKGYLLYHGNTDPIDDMAHANSPSTGSGTNSKENDEKPLWSSEELFADGNGSEGITEIIDHCSAAVLKISSGMTASSEADDMQSIAISQSEPELTNYHAEVDVKKIKQGSKKKGHFHILKKVSKGLLLSKK